MDTVVAPGLAALMLRSPAPARKPSAEGLRTESVQNPSAEGEGSSGGSREGVPALLGAAAAAGASGFYLETHPDPDRALSDRATQWPLDRLGELLERTLDIWHAARGTAPTASSETPS